MNNFGSATPGLQCLGLFSSFGWARGGKDGNALFGAQGITSGRHQGGIFGLCRSFAHPRVPSRAKGALLSTG